MTRSQHSKRAKALSTPRFSGGRSVKIVFIRHLFVQVRPFVLFGFYRRNLASHKVLVKEANSYYEKKPDKFGEDGGRAPLV